MGATGWAPTSAELWAGLALWLVACAVFNVWVWTRGE